MFGGCGIPRGWHHVFVTQHTASKLNLEQIWQYIIPWISKPMEELSFMINEISGMVIIVQIYAENII
jgi:hypothetical protein